MESLRDMMFALPLIVSTTTFFMYTKEDLVECLSTNASLVSWSNFVYCIILYL
jgi:hypothetical protein